MNIREIIVAALLAIGILGFVITAVGLVVCDDLYEQIHFLAPASLLGAVAIPAAVVVNDGFSQMGTKAILIAILLFLSNPVLSHATARAARVRRKQQLPPVHGEDFPVVKE
jgi:multicomponent Na+:H+ antiporter subunit G